MFESVGFFLVFALVKAVEVELADEAGDFFEFEVLWED